MKKLRTFLILCLALAVLAGCGGNADPTEPPTTPPTEAPTEAPTEPPTEAPTEPPIPVVGYHFSEPDGFVTLAATDALSILTGPDGDGSSISIVVLQEAFKFEELNEENFSAMLGILGDEGQEATLNAMEQTEVDGYPALMVDYTMTASEITARYLAYYVAVGQSTYSFTFGDASADGIWAEAYAASAATINILLEGEVVPVDTTGMELYDLGCGLSMYAAPGQIKEEVEGYAACMGDEYTVTFVLEDNKAEYGLYGLSLEDYSTFYVDGESITGFEMDPYGNLAASFVGMGGDGVEYFYYVTVKNTPDSFWLIQSACPSEMATLYVDSFAQWSATITETK